MFYVLICTQLAVCGRTEVSGCTQRHRRSASDCPYITLTEWLLRKERHECIPIEGSVKHKYINGQNVAIVLKGNNVFKHLFPFVCFLYSVKLQGNHKINKSSSCDEYTLLFELMMGHKLISNVLKNTCRLRLFHEFLAALLIL